MLEIGSPNPVGERDPLLQLSSIPILQPIGSGFDGLGYGACISLSQRLLLIVQQDCQSPGFPPNH